MPICRSVLLRRDNTLPSLPANASKGYPIWGVPADSPRNLQNCLVRLANRDSLIASMTEKPSLPAGCETNCDCRLMKKDQLGRCLVLLRTIHCGEGQSADQLAREL